MGRSCPRAGVLASAPAEAATPSLGIDVPLEPGGGHLRRRRARRGEDPAGRAPRAVRVFDDSRDVTSAFAVRRKNGRFRARQRAVARPQRAHRARRGCQRSERHGHEPPERRPGVLRPAGAAVGVPVDGGRLAVQPAGELPVPLQDHGRRVRRLRPGQPAVRRRHDDHRPGQDGALHRARRDRLPGPRPVQDRHPVRPGQAVGRRGSRRTAGTTSC